MLGNYSCPFDFQEFSFRCELETHIDKNHVYYRKDDSEADNSSNDFQSSSDSLMSLGEELPPVPSAQSLRSLSSVLNNIDIPENPLSDIGKLTERRLLKISDSPSLGALKELRLDRKGLSQFNSNDKFKLSKLINLRILDLSGNYITSLSGVGECVSLYYLNINNNSIEDLSSISHLSQLKTLKASNNNVKDINPLVKCRNLVTLKITKNKLCNFEKTLRTLCELKSLKTLSLLMNPCIINTKDFKDKLIFHLNLDFLDKSTVKFEDKIRSKIHRSVINPRISKPVLSRSDVFKPDTDQYTELKWQKIIELKSENAKLRQELSKVWQVLGYVIKIKDAEMHAKLLKEMSLHTEP